MSTATKTFFISLLTFVLAVSLQAGLRKPAADQFGLGPRVSKQGLFTATLTPSESLKPRKMMSIEVRIIDTAGNPLDGATITIDGGMPQHGHGLPTKPSIGAALGDGRYRIDGVRFNMGGWWEFKLNISTPAAADTITFNLMLSRNALTTEEMEEAKQLSIHELEAIPQDPTNRYADDPRAAAFGRKLFFDAKLSSNGKVSCATCHLPDRNFQDDKALANGVGTTDRRTMPIAGTARSPFLFWDGRKDSQWAQALGPLESPVEHGGTREQYARVIVSHYRPEYEQVFGQMPALEDREAATRVFVNIGKSIAAFERTVDFKPTRFDNYLDGKAKFTSDEVAGLKLFVGKANCTQCHNGPMLTNNEFHNTGVPAGAKPDRGRIAGSDKVLKDEFNCRSKWSDASAKECPELEFMTAGAERAFKVPSLRNVADRAPYMHAGQFKTMEQVVDHYNSAPAAPAGHSELKPLGLTPNERKQLVAFLRTLR